jgi:hypothetical protein
MIASIFEVQGILDRNPAEGHPYCAVVLQDGLGNSRIPKGIP